MDTSISLSSRAAFSYEWNNYVNKHKSCIVKFLKSSKAFLQSLFCGYSVNIVKVEELYIKNENYADTLFLEEYNRKLEARNILVRRAFLQNKTNDLSEVWKGTERKVVVFSEMKKAVEDEDFKDFDCYFSRENITLLSVKEYEWLFNRSFVKHRAEIVSRLLVTKTGRYLINLIFRKEMAILMLLINDGLLPGVIHLVEKCNISVNSRVEDLTPLIVAAIHGYVECLDWLLENGADFNLAGPSCFTALHHAAAFGHLECINRILDEDVVTLLNENTGVAPTPLYLSVINGHIECINVLIDAGSDINQSSDSEGNAPLHASIMKKQMDSFKVLLKNEDINIYKENYHFETPFHWAAGVADDAEYLKLLINVAGSYYFNKRNADGCTPYDYAVDDDIKENIEILAPYNIRE